MAIDPKEMTPTTGGATTPGAPSATPAPAPQQSPQTQPQQPTVAGYKINVPQQPDRGGTKRGMINFGEAEAYARKKGEQEEADKWWHVRGFEHAMTTMARTGKAAPEVLGGIAKDIYESSPLSYLTKTGPISQEEFAKHGISGAEMQKTMFGGPGAAPARMAFEKANPTLFPIAERADAAFLSAMEWWGYGKAAGLMGKAVTPLTSRYPILKTVIQAAGKAISRPVSDEMAAATSSRIVGGAVSGAGLGAGGAEIEGKVRGVTPAIAPNVALGVVLGAVGGFFDMDAMSLVAKHLDTLNGALGAAEREGMVSIEKLGRNLAGSEGIEQGHALRAIVKVAAGKGTGAAASFIRMSAKSDPELFRNPFMQKVLKAAEDTVDGKVVTPIAEIPKHPYPALSQPHAREVVDPADRGYKPNFRFGNLPPERAPVPYEEPEEPEIRTEPKAPHKAVVKAVSGPPGSPDDPAKARRMFSKRLDKDEIDLTPVHYDEAPNLDATNANHLAAAQDMLHHEGAGAPPLRRAPGGNPDHVGWINKVIEGTEKAKAEALKSGSKVAQFDDTTIAYATKLADAVSKGELKPGHLMGNPRQLSAVSNVLFKVARNAQKEGDATKFERTITSARDFQRMSNVSDNAGEYRPKREEPIVRRSTKQRLTTKEAVRDLTKCR